MTGKGKQYYIYLRSTKERIPCTEQEFHNYYRDIDTFRKKQQRHGRCVCPESKRLDCDMDCATCPFRRAGDSLSLDYTAKNDEGDERPWLDDLPDVFAVVDVAVEEAELLEALHLLLLQVQAPSIERDIFLLDARGQASVLRKAPYQSEAALQRLVTDHPEVLNCVLSPVNQPFPWIFVVREVGVPDHSDGGAQWFLDHLLLAQDAIPTLVEVKRSTDSRIRREVVGQMLDYATNGCAYWDVSALRSDYEARCRDTGRDPLVEFCTDVEGYWERVETNLRDRKLRLLFVADEIPDSLRRIIEFLNEQMENTEVLGVELRQFISDQEHQILAPQVIGRTTPAQQIKNRSNFAWTEETYMERARKVVGKDQADACRRLVRAFEELGCEIYWGRGRKQAGFVPIYQGKRRHQLCAAYIYEHHIGIEIYFEHFKAPYNTEDRQRELMSAFNAIPGIDLREKNCLGRRPSFKAEELLRTETLEGFIEVYRAMLKKIREYEKIPVKQ